MPPPCWIDLCICVNFLFFNSSKTALLLGKLKVPLLVNIHTNLYSAKIVRTNLRRRSVVEFLVKLVYRVLFRRNHSSWNKMWPIATHVAWSVCVYPLVTSMSCAKWLN